MKKIGIVALLALVILAAGIMGYRSMYDNLVSMEQQVKEKYSQIDNQLQRRADLIPNLVNVVKGYAKHEKDIFTELAAARTALTNAKTVTEKSTANSSLDAALSRLMVLVENYPTLKANENYLALQDELSGTENRIAVARKDYNTAVKEFNSYHKSFFVNMFFGSRYSDFEYLETSQTNKSVPKVDMN